MQIKKETKALIWFTKNLRVNDSILLSKASREYDRVIGVYCFDPREFKEDIYGFKKTEKFRAKFLIESVKNLHRNLKEINISLLVYYEHPEFVIPEICNTNGIDALFYQNEWTQEELRVIKKVTNSLESTSCFGYYDQFLYHPNDVFEVIPNIPDVFSNFRKAIEQKLKIRPVHFPHKKSTSNLLKKSVKIPDMNNLGYNDFETHHRSAFPFKGGESQALERLKIYFFDTKKISIYKKTRNGLVGVNYSSKFSPWLANGCISAKTIYWELKLFEKENTKNDSTYWLIFELMWRDFFKYISKKYGNAIFKLEGIFNKSYPYNTDWKLLSKWVNGETKEPFINANMIELNKTGWMSNRGRQNVASYFTKELNLDWRIGAAYFESMLVDYDVHSNYGNWMYLAGVGNDPRERVFNVKLQAKRYDSEHTFRNLWLQNSLF